MYHVVMECINFSSYKEAEDFQDALITIFCQMKKPEGVGAINRIDFVEDEID